MGVLQGQTFIRGRHSKPPYLPLLTVLNGLSSDQIGAIDLMGTFYNSIMRVAKEELSFEVLFKDILLVASHPNHPNVKAVAFDNFSLQAGQDSPCLLGEECNCSQASKSGSAAGGEAREIYRCFDRSVKCF